MPSLDAELDEASGLAQRTPGAERNVGVELRLKPLVGAILAPVSSSLACVARERASRASENCPTKF